MSMNALGRSARIGMALLLGAAASLAQTPHAKPVSVVAPPSGGQPALAVGFVAAGDLVARVCPRMPCTVDGGESLQVPAEARALATGGRLSVLRLGQGRHAVHAAIADPARSRSWEAVVVARPGAAQPHVVFSGWTGLVQGEDGERRGPMVVVSGPQPDRSRSIVVGEQREDMTLCGRPAVISPRLLLASDLKLHPAKVQRLSAEDRSGAVTVTAQRASESTPAATASLLRVVAATSAVGQPKALTDGDPSTTWAENRGREGRGEFVLMQAPAELPIESFEVVIRPPDGEPEHGVAPQVFYLVTTHRIFEVRMPEDAWEHPGARYHVELGQPVQTDCVALVTESAFRVSRQSRVTFAELSATSSFGQSSPDELVGALARGGPGAEAAGAVLRSLGEAGFAAVAKAYDELPPAGRRVALDVIDHAPCPISAPVYARALVGHHAGEQHHARTRLRRCGSAAAEALVTALGRASPRNRAPIADELALIAPARAIEVILPLLQKANRKRRGELRVVLARASESSRARPAVEAALVDDRLSEVAAVDLLRALGPRLAGFRPAATRAFGRLARPQASFRTRYLLLEPAAELAGKDSGALAYLRSALVADQSPYIRAQAARVVRDPTRLPNELVRALRDPNVRVREAAARTLAVPRGKFAAPALIERLEDDPWPLVRSAAAEALAELGPGAEYNRALHEALDDSSRHVRAPVLWALGRRGARQYAEAVRERLEDSDESPYVRIAAAEALGAMCDTGSVDALTKYALLLADPAAAGPTRVVAPAALRALGRLHPSDLAERLAPLLSKHAPSLSRQAAREVLSGAGACQR